MGSKMKTLKKVGKWAVPTSGGLEKLVDKVMQDPKMKNLIEKTGNSREVLERMVRQESEKVYDDTKNLRRFATVLDTANKATVPVDATLDYFNLMGGVGTGARAVKTIATSPGYLAYDAYYLGKTGDLLGTLGNIAYEAVSWLSPGGLSHLWNRYTRQADKYMAKEVKKSVKERVEKGRDVVIKFPGVAEGEGEEGEEEREVAAAA